MNHELEADYRHTLERLGLDPCGVEAVAARSHARQAGRHAAMAGQHLSDASGHIAGFPALSLEYELGIAEGKCALASGLSRSVLGEYFDARAALDTSIQRRDSGQLDAAVEAVFFIVAENPVDTPPFFSDVPEIGALALAAVEYRQSVKAAQEAAAQHAAWEASLPTAAQLKEQLAAEACGEGASFNFEGYTLWHEPEYGGWSLTNAYGVDYCAFLSSERDFQWLLDKVKKGVEIGPVPHMCQDPPDDELDHPDFEAMSACAEASMAILTRMQCLQGGSDGTRSSV